jgi:hypothetical protein
MAKIHEMKFFEQHLEKVILGVCTLILLYGVYQWALPSPQNTGVQVDGRPVPATEVDRQLLSWAERLKRRKPPTGPLPPVYNYDEEIIKNRKIDISAIKDWGVHRQVMLSPDSVKPPEGIHPQKIKDILLAFAPEFTEIKGTRELINKDGGVDQLVFRGNAEFNRGALLKAWNKVFRTSAMDEVQAVILTVEIEKREVLDEGMFGPVTQVTRVQIPLKEGEKPVPDVVIPQYTGKNAEEVRAAVLEQLKNQHRIQIPPYWGVWSLEKQAWTKPWVQEEQPPAPVGDASKKPAPKPKVVAGNVPVVPGPVINDGIIKLCFHDTEVSVQKKYSYRMRILFVSPLYTYDDIVYKGTPKGAMEKSMPSQWSQWTQADAIPRTTRFFVTSAQVFGGVAKMHCTVFTRSLGQEVSEKFEVLPGRIIGGMVSKQIKNPVNKQVGQKVVDFSTNTIAVHANFSRKVARKRGSRGKIRELICLDDGKLVLRILVKDMETTDERCVEYNKLQALVEGKTP